MPQSRLPGMVEPMRWLAALSLFGLLGSSSCSLVAGFSSSGRDRGGPSMPDGLDLRDAAAVEARTEGDAVRPGDTTATGDTQLEDAAGTGDQGGPDGPTGDSSPSTVKILSAAADAQIEEDHPTVTDNSSRFKVGSDTGRGRRGLIRFRLPNLPTGALVTSAQLTLCSERLSTASKPIHEVHRLLSSWSETSVSWNTQPSVVSIPTASFIGPTKLGQCVTIPVLSDVKRWVAQPASNHGWLLKNRDAGIDEVGYASRDHSTAAWHPKLAVTYRSP